MTYTLHTPIFRGQSILIATEIVINLLENINIVIIQPTKQTIIQNAINPKNPRDGKWHFFDDLIPFKISIRVFQAVHNEFHLKIP